MAENRFGKKSAYIVLSSPSLLIILYWGRIKKVPGTISTASVAVNKKFLKGKDSVFAKPITDFGGHGIEKVKVKDIKSVAKFKKERLDKKQYLLEEELKQQKEAIKENTARYTELEEKYNTLEKSYSDIEARNTQLTNNERGLKLQVEIFSQGFKKEQFDEVSALRNSLFKDEEDDAKAVSSIKEKYKATYFPEPEKVPSVPNEPSFNSTTEPKKEIKITRKTSLRDLLKK